jgi:putative ABC transport system ATP-binding protein
MIRLEQLSVVFAQGTADENTALRNLSLSVERGDFITVIGSNGAGKTTLYNSVAGTIIPSSGRIFLRGSGGEGEITGNLPLTNEREITGNLPFTSEREITREPEYLRARYIGRIFQNPLLGTAGKMTLEDNMMICHRKGYKGLRISLNRSMREYFRSELRRLDMGLENRLGDNVELFSGGQRQALTLLMAVMSRPSLLLLDEHTAALDPRNAELVLDLTLRFAADYGLTAMMITHNMNHALSTGNRLLMMDRGEIILDIDAAEKAKLSAADVVQRFKDIKKQDLSNDDLLLSPPPVALQWAFMGAECSNNTGTAFGAAQATRRYRVPVRPPPAPPVAACYCPPIPACNRPRPTSSFAFSAIFAVKKQTAKYAKNAKF